MTPAAKGSSREKEAVQNQVDAFVSAWNSHDSRAMAMIYADDADLVNPFGRIAKSRAEIEMLFRDEHTGSLKDSYISVMLEGVRLLTPEVAVSDHTFEVSGARDRSGKETTLRGHLTLAFKKHGDTWQIVACRPMIPATNRQAK